MSEQPQAQVHKCTSSCAATGQHSLMTQAQRHRARVSSEWRGAHFQPRGRSNIMLQSINLEKPHSTHSTPELFPFLVGQSSKTRYCVRKSSILRSSPNRPDRGPLSATNHQSNILSYSHILSLR